MTSGAVLVNNIKQTRHVVDRRARDCAAEVLRRFIAGQITNDEFEDRAPETADPAIGAIWDTAWLYYSDFKEHKLVGRDRLHPDAKRACVRWVLFLDSNNPYEWPSISNPGSDPAIRTTASLLRAIRRWFGLEDIHTEEDIFLAAGHYPVWPFISQKDYRKALRNPRRLSGGARQ